MSIGQTCQGCFDSLLELGHDFAGELAFSCVSIKDGNLPKTMHFKTKTEVKKIKNCTDMEVLSWIRERGCKYVSLPREFRVCVCVRQCFIPN